MNTWSNIEISSQDPETIEIDNFEEAIGKISEDVKQVRELITRFEVCHFKYQQHFKHIKASIITLKPCVVPIQIGSNHISKGKNVLSRDKTGRSILGQKYVNSLMKWLGDCIQEDSNYFNEKIHQRIIKWLGNSNADKKRLVRLLIARLTWNWKAYEEYQIKGEYKELEYQVCRMDICHYAFPEHLELLLQGIGRLEPVDKFEGCGSFNIDIKAYVEKQFLILCDYLKINSNENIIEQDEKIKLWLVACLAKTLKEQVGLKEFLPQLISSK